MKHFLLRYGKRSGELEVEEFDGVDARRDALRARFRAEADRPSSDIEVVVLEARSLKDIQRTHQRYFLTARQMAGSGEKLFRTAS